MLSEYPDQDAESDLESIFRLQLRLILFGNDDSRYAVISKAELNEFDKEYFATARRMRDLVILEYGCTEFTSCIEGVFEISISYWHTRELIQNWKQNKEQVKAHN